MTITLLDKYKQACDYTGIIDDAAVEKHLREYLEALGIKRKIVRLRRNWTLDEYPALDATIQSILNDFRSRQAALDALDALAALDARDAHDALDALDARAARDAWDARDARAARDARDARDARAARHRFAEWCIFRGDWWWTWEMSWLATTFIGARQTKNAKVKAWARPVFDSFVAGCWSLFWTSDTLYWIAKPSVHVDERRRLHMETGPAVVCDINDLYFWHGVLVPSHWIEDRENLDPNEVILSENVEQRAAGAELCGWNKMFEVLDVKIIDEHPSPTIGQLIEMTLPGLENPGRFLRALCPRNGWICEGVPYISDIDGKPIETAIAAQAYGIGDPQDEYVISPRRT